MSAQAKCFGLRLPPVRDSLLSSQGSGAGRPQYRLPPTGSACAVPDPRTPLHTRGERVSHLVDRRLGRAAGVVKVGLAHTDTCAWSGSSVSRPTHNRLG